MSRPQFRRTHVLVALSVSAPLLLLASCGDADESVPAVDGGAVIAVEPTPALRTDAPLPSGAEARSLLGEPLSRPDVPNVRRAEQESQLQAAEAALAQSPNSADALIWVGRRQAYLGRYQQALRTFQRGFEVHDEDPRFLRHSGHRLITLRRLEEAVSDLGRAAGMIRGQEVQIEPDGQPNARGIPTSSLQSNIWYHLGLAHYLLGDLEAALDAYRECLAVSRNPDGVVSASHWLYTILRRLGRDEEAAAVLEPITEDMDVIENQSYHELLLLYKGLRTAEDLIGPEGSEASPRVWQSPTAWARGTSTRAGKTERGMSSEASWRFRTNGPRSGSSLLRRSSGARGRLPDSW